MSTIYDMFFLKNRRYLVDNAGRFINRSILNRMLPTAMGIQVRGIRQGFQVSDFVCR